MIIRTSSIVNIRYVWVRLYPPYRLPSFQCPFTCPVLPTWYLYQIQGMIGTVKCLLQQILLLLLFTTILGKWCCCWEIYGRNVNTNLCSIWYLNSIYSVKLLCSNQDTTFRRGSDLHGSNLLRMFWQIWIQSFTKDIVDMGPTFWRGSDLHGSSLLQRIWLTWIKPFEKDMPNMDVFGLS